MRGRLRAARGRLAELERRAKARAEAGAVAEGMAETVALHRARGSVVVLTGGEGAVRATAYRRQAGLDWLAGKGRIDARAKAAGERYGAAYRRLKMEGPIRSTLDIRPGGGRAPEAPLGRVLSHAEGTVRARASLAEMRRRLGGQRDLVAACDLICGEEKTPREAAGGEREAGRLEAVLKVALDLLTKV